jgi:hypothetical protein
MGLKTGDKEVAGVSFSGHVGDAAGPRQLTASARVVCVMPASTGLLSDVVDGFKSFSASFS